MVQAAAEAVAEAETPGLLARVQTMIAERFFKLVGGKQKVWPPSREAMPLQVVGFVSLIVVLAFGVRQKVQPKVLVVEERRRDYALSSLK